MGLPRRIHGHQDLADRRSEEVHSTEPKGNRQRQHRHPHAAGVRITILTASVAGLIAASWTPQVVAAQAPAHKTSALPSTPLQAAWDSTLADSPSIAHATVSAYAYDVTTHTPLAAIHPTWRLTPASVNKLFTSVAGLATFGPGFRYSTQVRVSAQPGGPIYLIGNGDPWLEANGGLGLENLAKSVARHVRHAQDVVGVSTAFGPTTLGAGWPWEDLPYSYAAPISALTSARDEIHIVVSPAPTAGQPPEVAVNPENPSTVPAPPFLTIANHALTGAVGSSNSLTINHTPGTDHFVITGRIPAGAAAVDDYLTMDHPVLMTALTFQRILEKDGVSFSSSATTGTLPQGTRTVLTHRSPPLTHYLQIQNTFSINSMAEALFHALGAHAFGVGTSANSQAAVANFLTSHHVAQSSVHLDGSGLSPFDEVSARDAVELLTYAATQSWFRTFEHSLIHIGRTNQCSFLCGLMDNTAADGTVWLKTGNLNNQWNYAGYATAKNGNLIAFAVLIDGLPAGQYYNDAVGPIDDMTVAVASYPSETATANTLSASSNSGNVSLPPQLASVVGPITPGDVLSGSLVELGSGGQATRTAWQSGGNLRVEAGLLPRLGVALAALRHGSSIAGADVQAQGTRSGTVFRGNLILDGRWDPSLTAAGLAALAQDVAATGIRSVSGHVEGVAGPAPSWYAEPWPPGIPWESLDSALTPPISPLSAGQDQVTLSVGDRPSGSGQDQVQVLPAGTGVTARLAAQVPGSKALQPTVSWVRGTDTFVVSGSLTRPGTPQSITVSAPDPAAAATALFRTDLIRDGVQVQGISLLGKAPSGTSVIATLPAVATQAIASASLTAPSGYLSLDLFGTLGAKAADVLATTFGSVDDVPDPTGLGTENYLTADSVTGLMAQDMTVPGDVTLLQALQRPWVAPTAEGETAVGLIRSQGHTYVYCVIVSGKRPSAATVAALDAGLDE